jgi:histidinol phosphatase-like PHP family hydrolase
MQRIVAAAVEAGVALEINPRLKIPSEQFVRLAQGAGVKFTIGSGSTQLAGYGEWAYVLELQEHLKLGWKDMWVPGHGPTAARRELKR